MWDQLVDAVGHGPKHRIVELIDRGTDRDDDDRYAARARRVRCEAEHPRVERRAKGRLGTLVEKGQPTVGDRR